MFTVLYFWYTMIILLNIADFFIWLYTISPQNRRTFIRKRLHSKKYPLTHETRDREKINKFANDYLEADGFFMLILIKENSSDFVASEIVHRLYTEKFLKKYDREYATGTTIYDAIDLKQDEDLENHPKRRPLCSMVC